MQNVTFLVNLLDGWASTTARSTTHATTRHATLWHPAAACSLVDLHHDGVHNALELLLLGLKLILLSKLILVQPVQCLLHCGFDLLLVTRLELVLQLLLIQGVAHSEAVVLQAVLGFDLLLVLLILCTELLSLLHHAVNFRLGEATLLVGDCDLIRLSSGLVRGTDVQDAVGIDVIGDLDLRHTTRGWRNAIQVELTKQVVVLGHGTLSLEDLDQDARLIVRIGGEGLRLLCWNCRIPWCEFLKR
eukprot:Skav220742  [mRNA]  locus=scaffold2753:402066:402800:+ [translate_table: standard]